MLTDETMNHIRSEYSKLTKKWKSRHECAGKGIDWELCKRLEFDYTDKLYIHKPESDLENEMHSIISDFKIQKDLQTPVRRLNLELTRNELLTGCLRGVMVKAMDCGIVVSEFVL